jgi:hypothetical protein
VLEEDSVLYLKRDDGSRVDIRKSAAPYIVQETGQPPGPMTNLWQEIRTWLTRQQVDGVDRPVISLVTRGEPIPPISLPLAPGEKARLRAGTYPLYLAWRGGEPPYQVRLTTADGKELLKQSNITAPGGNTQPFKTAPLDLAPGQYQLIISDALRQTRIAVEVLPTTALPTPPATLRAVDTADIRQTLEALWLASQGEAWRLEAYQQVMPLEGQHRPARLLRYSLEKGEALPSIKTD